MPYGEKKAYSFFKMKGSPMKRNFGISPVKQETKEKPTEKKIDDLADVLGLIPGIKQVGQALSYTKKKIHESKFAQKHLIRKKTELNPLGKFINKYYLNIEQPSDKGTKKLK